MPAGFIHVPLAKNNRQLQINALQNIKNAPHAGEATIKMISWQQPDNAHGTGSPGSVAIVTADVAGSPGHAVAHQHVQALQDRINNDNALAGLANHWCCYSDY